MSIEQYQRDVNSIDKEIATLEKKKAEIDKKYADLSKKIYDTEKTITPRTSTSTAASKIRQISSWQSDCAKKSAESADLGKKIADKRQRRNDAYLNSRKLSKMSKRNRQTS